MQHCTIPNGTRVSRIEEGSMQTSTQDAASPPRADLRLLEIHQASDLPDWLSEDDLAGFLHEKMKPYEDRIPDIHRALQYAFSKAEGKGGLILLATSREQIVGAIVFLHTGMQGYVPEDILVFVGVDPQYRNQGIGGWLIQEGLARCPGAVKLHVEYDNPAKRLYERLGFRSKYAEMRYQPEK
ncbi:MAG: GNAT family N-acetyltransferase [Candidatus Eisenbacteria bacterium]|nr:GNAT family N-acetyltransferase [Candidatus Eisenbacteria bacterium]